MNSQHRKARSSFEFSLPFNEKILRSVFMGVIGFWYVIQVAWMSDDGLINIRTALNMSVGAGPVFNVGERVQGYTSPLWFWIQYLAGSLTGEFIWTTILLGSILAICSFIWLSYIAKSSSQAIAVGISILLSTTILDYSTGGLENPLTMFLVVVFLSALVRHPILKNRSDVVLIAITASLIFLTRFDYLIVLIPMLLLAFSKIKRTQEKMIFIVSLCSLPALWFLFSYAYYGYFLPNTFRAKLNLDIPRMELIFSGLRYLMVTLTADPVIAVVFLGALVVVLVERNKTNVLIFSSTLLYLCYVVWIGGDFMAGRFMTTPLVIWLWLIATCPTNWRTSESVTIHAFSYLLIGMLTFVSIQTVITDKPTYNSGERWSIEPGGIADEAAFYRSGGSSLIGSMLETRGSAESFADLSADKAPRLFEIVQMQKLWYRSKSPSTGTARPVFVTCGDLGSRGISLGPSVYIIDECALVDPFLSQITFKGQNFGWRIGHFIRPLPEDYENAIRFADSSYIADRNLRIKLESIWSKVRSS